MIAKWKQFEKEGFNPYIWIFTNGETLSVNDVHWASKIMQNYLSFKFIKAKNSESVNFIDKRQ